MKKTNLFISLLTIGALASCGPKHSMLEGEYITGNASVHYVKCAGCGKYHYEEPHTFEFLEEIPATCLDIGSKVYQCACGEKRVETFDSLGHEQGSSYKYDENNHYYECSRPNCDHKIGIAPHSYVISNIVEPTCEKTGSQTKTCACGYSYVETITAKGHNYGSAYEYNDDGMHYLPCLNPGCDAKTEYKAHNLIPTVVTTKTCTMDGVIRYTCDTCNFSTTVTDKAEGHALGEWTRFETGHYRVCGVCNEKIDVETHNFDINETKPTCTTDGSKIKTCNTCGYEVVETYDKLGHKPESNWSYGETGHYHTCLNSGCEEVFDFAAHDFKDTVIKEGSCTEDRIIEHSCKTCGYECQTTTPAPGHIASDWTESDVGTHIKTCLVCEEEIEREPHESRIQYKDVTCTENGYYIETCNICGYHVEETTPAAGHDWECESISETQHKSRCSTCGEEIITEHDMHEETIKAPTYYEVGLKRNYCTECDYEMEYIAAHLGSCRVDDDAPFEYLSSVYCARRCSIEGCEKYVTNGRQHNFVATRVVSYPDGDTPGIKESACSYCLVSKPDSEVEFTGTPVNSLTVTMESTPEVGKAVKDCCLYSIVEENTRCYTSYYMGNGRDMRPCAVIILRATDETFYPTSSSNDWEHVFTEEELSQGYELYMYMDVTSNAYFPWDNDKCTPAVVATINGKYKATVSNSTDKMSGYWVFHFVVTND